MNVASAQVEMSMYLTSIIMRTTLDIDDPILREVLAAAFARLMFGLGSAGVLARSVRRTHARGRSAAGRIQTTEGG
jgi:hypothetical protein